MYQWTLKRIALLAVASGMAVNAFAMNNGFYMGIMMGSAGNSGGDVMAQKPTVNNTFGGETPATPRSTQFGTRIFIGNQFNRYAAIEGGGTYFSTIQYNTKGVETCGGTSQRVRDLDVVGKGILPFANFSAYAKAGAALTYVTTAGGLNPTFDAMSNPPVTCGSTSYKNKFSPTVSVGASYDLNQSWMVDASYNTIQLSSNGVNSVHLYAIGISYHFTDKYCGQFLCDD